MSMKKTISNKWTNLNETEKEFVNYLVWLYKKAVDRKSISTKRISHNGSAQICLDKISSAICWLYLSQNKSLAKTLAAYHKSKNSDQRDAIASELFFKFGIMDPDDANGFFYKGLICKSEPVTIINQSLLDAPNGGMNLHSLLKQRLLLTPAKHMYLSIDLNHSIKDIKSKLSSILSNEITSRSKDGVGSRSFQLENIFLQVIGYYFSGAKRKNEIVRIVFGLKNNKEDKFQPVQFREARKQFLRITEQAPQIFFK